MTITHETLAELERLEKEATAGPWCVHPNGTSVWSGAEYDSLDGFQWQLFGVPLRDPAPSQQEWASVNRQAERFTNPELITALRNAAPDLIANCRQVEELRAALGKSRERIRELEAHHEGFSNYVMTYAPSEIFSGALNAAGEAVEALATTEGVPAEASSADAAHYAHAAQSFAVACRVADLWAERMQRGLAVTGPEPLASGLDALELATRASPLRRVKP